jgi:cell wall-associated NlpC family hydrolase
MYKAAVVKETRGSKSCAKSSLARPAASLVQMNQSDPLPARLARWAAIAAVLALAACSSAPPARDPARQTAPREVPSRLSLEQAHDVTIYAISLVGTPYRYGGNTPQGGFDCSGLIGHVYKTHGALSMPRTVARLQDIGQPVPLESLRSGDLVLFSQRGEATHAGIYVGANRFVHAPSRGGEVRLESLSAKHWAAQQITFRRP